MHAGITEVAELRPPVAAGFRTRELEEYEHELVARRIGSSVSSVAGSSSAVAPSSRTITPVKGRAEELGPLAVKFEDDVGQLREEVIGPEDHLPPGQEDHLMRTIMERSVRYAAEDVVRNRRELEIEQIFLEKGVTTSQASASKEANLRILKAEQDKIWIDLDTEEGGAPPSPPSRRRRCTRRF
ncbi:Nitrate reductase (NADH) [Hordeum vulgare]|nr:Nitrate reductase (NADH) [Hordeum vulgare]